MAVTVDSAVAYALQQPGVRPLVLCTLDSSSGDVYRFSVDTVTHDGVTYAALLRQSPSVRVTPAAPELGQLGGVSVSLDLMDGCHSFAALRPGYFEGASLSIRYALDDVSSAVIRAYGFRVTDVAKPDPGAYSINAEDHLSSLRRVNFPSDPWLISNMQRDGLNSNRGDFQIMPTPQPHIEGANRCFPIMFGQCVAPCFVQWTISLSDVNSEPAFGTAGSTRLYEPIFGSRHPTGFDIVQRWNDNYSQVASVGNDYADNIDAGHGLAADMHPNVVEIHSGTPVHEGFQVVPIYYGGLSQSLIEGEDRHTVTPPETLRFFIDSEWTRGPFGVAAPFDGAAADSLHVLYRAPIATNGAFDNNPGSASAICFHGFHGFLQEQRPLDQYIGNVMHDGLLGVVWRDQIVPIGLPFSRSAVASFTTANIIEGSLTYRDIPLAQLETTRTVYYRRQSRDVEPVTSFTWSAHPNGAATSRVCDFIGHSIPAWRVTQFWAKREAFGARRWTWRTGLHAAAMEQHDLVTLDYPTMGASGQLCEVDAVMLLPDWSIQVEARESSYDLFTFTDTPDINWRPDLRFMQRVPFPQSSWALGTSGSSFQVNHILIGVPDAAAAFYTSPQLTASYPSSLVTATASTAILFVTNVANSGATVSQFEKILLGWDLAKRG